MQSAISAVTIQNLIGFGKFAHSEVLVKGRTDLLEHFDLTPGAGDAAPPNKTNKHAAKEEDLCSITQSRALQ